MPETNAYTYKYPHPAVTTDCVIFGYEGKELSVLLIERGNDPYKGMMAFPGGFLNIDETLEECARRELKEETFLEVTNLEQIHAFSTVDRDPRERVISVVFWGLIKKTAVRGGDDAKLAKWIPLNNVPHLAFDHDYVLQKAINFLKKKIFLKSVSPTQIEDAFASFDFQLEE